MKIEENRNTYKSILKGTSIFGGVQVFNIVINLIRGKFVAIILGPEGMGISSLFATASNTIQRFGSLGLNQAIVRETALHTESGENQNPVMSTVLMLIRSTALIGLIICVAFCVPLSRLTFGSESYWWQFMLLGVAVGFSILSAGKLAILQGLHEVKRISKASIVGGLVGLCVGVPLYYLFGYKGIVPAMVALALAMYLFYTINLRKASGRIMSIGFNWKENFPVIKRLILLGFVLMASDAIGSMVNYLLNLFLRHFGSIDIVGLFQAANSVTNQYAGLVFAAMAMDYYPRLSRVMDDNIEMRKVVNRQTEIVSFLIAPAMCLLILSAPLVIRVLLSESFYTITPLMRWMGFGILLKALSFPMGYITFAKGDKKVFFLLEGLFGNLLFLVSGCVGFYLFGLIGLGYALVFENLVAIVVYYIVDRKLYDYNFSEKSFINLLLAILAVGLCFGASFFVSTALAYTFMGTVSMVTIVWSFVNIKARLR